MAHYTNLTSINLGKQSETTQYFNNYYDVLFDMSSNEYDTVLAFFENFTGSIESAKVLSSGVIYTAKKNGLDVIKLLSEFSALGHEKLSHTLALFLNSQRYQSSYLGVNTRTQVSKTVLRTIIY